MKQNLLKRLPSPKGMERTEILNLLLSEEYGFLPDPPESITVDTESEENTFCAGKAVLKKLKMNCKTKHGIFSFPFSQTFHVLFSFSPARLCPLFFLF